MKRETLKQRLAIIRREGIRCGLDGCPVGGWPETRQAMLRLADELPRRDERDYDIRQLVAALYWVNDADRYEWRETNDFSACPVRPDRST